MKTYITGGTLVTPHQVFPGYSLIIENGKIADVVSGAIQPEPDSKTVEVKGCWVTPGFVDIHFHGAMGSSAMDSTPEALHKISRYIARHGVTSYLPTTWSASPELTLASIRNIVDTHPVPDGARHLGVHIEGPYLNVDYRGAQLPELIRKPSADEYRKWIETGMIRLVTIAPEIEGAEQFISEGVESGIEFTIGHSGATYEQVIKAADHGVRQATHIFNGMVGLHHRDPGTVGGILADDRIYAQVICDGVHIHPAVVKTLIRAKGSSRVILITDAIRGTGLDDGDYDFFGQKIIVRGGVARTPQGGLSGSTLTMDQAIRNALNFTGLPFNEVLSMATSVPAEAMGWKGVKGILAPGADADINILDAGFNVLRTMIAGQFIN